jgi:hypothetical protein
MRRIDGVEISLLAQMVTRAQDPIPASHIDGPGEVEQNPMKTRALNTLFPAMKLCLILGLRW